MSQAVPEPKSIWHVEKAEWKGVVFLAGGWFFGDERGDPTRWQFGSFSE